MAEGIIWMRIVIIAGILSTTAGFLLAWPFAGLVEKIRAAVNDWVLAPLRSAPPRPQKGGTRPLRRIVHAESNWSRAARLDALQ